MKIRSRFLAFVCCLSLLLTAFAPVLHARSSDDDNDQPHKKKKKTASAAVHHKKSADTETRHRTPAKKTASTHRIIPATTTAEDEETRPVDVGPVDPNRPPPVYARSVMLIDARTGEVLYEKDPDARRPIASTTKLITALIVAESGNLSGTVEVQPIDTICEPTKLYFKPGEHYARNALLYALLVHSCNDVARALARDNAGSIPDFADKMNSRAAQLGARDTHFVNPNGLPSPGEEQWSTARDLSKIARVVYGNPVLRPIMATQHLQFQMASGRTQEFANTNKVLLRFPYCNGMKTGYTDAAGHCLVSSADDGNGAIISVCLGDSKAIWNDSQRLLSYGLALETARRTGQQTPSLNNSPSVGSDKGNTSWTTLSKAN